MTLIGADVDESTIACRQVCSWPDCAVPTTNQYGTYPKDELKSG